MSFDIPDFLPSQSRSYSTQYKSALNIMRQYYPTRLDLTDFVPWLKIPIIYGYLYTSRFIRLYLTDFVPWLKIPIIYGYLYTSSFIIFAV